MESQPLSRANKNVLHDDDFYCADPNCSYCKHLRAAEEQWKKAQEEVRKS